MSRGIKIDTFGGMVPAVDDRLLQDRAAAHAENCWLYSGRLAGIPQPEHVRACTAGTAKVFRIPNAAPDAAHIGDSLWLEFENADTDVVRAPVRDDTFDRYYWASSTDNPKYNTRERISDDDPEWLLGIPAPSAPAVTPSGGSGAAATRSYVHTWVSAYGEEGPPSDPITVTGKVDDTWAVVLDPAAATDLGGTGDVRYLTKSRIYRTITSDAGVATYFLVAEQDIADETYDDTLTDAVVAANSQLESTNWSAPPEDLQGLAVMPNGILAGWRANELWFSEPYRPHAWPAAYVLTMDYPIVGLGVANQTLVVCTQGYPSTVTGVHPSAMSQSISASLEPCVSRGSILSTAEAVYYASPNGLISARQGQFTNITRELLTKDKWTSLAAVTTLRAALLGTAYFAFGTTVDGVFDSGSFDELSFAQDDFSGAHAGILIDPQNVRIGFNLLSDTEPVTSVQNDPWSGEIFIVKDDNLYRVNVSAADPVRRPYLWRSKIFQLPYKRNLGAMRVYWRVPTALAPDDPGEAPESPIGVEFPSIPDGSGYGVVRVYANDQLITTLELDTPGEIMRLPSGFKADFWQLEFETYVDVYNIQVAPTVKDLGSV